MLDLIFLFYECHSVNFVKQIILAVPLFKVSNMLVDSKASTVVMSGAPIFTVVIVQGC